MTGTLFEAVQRRVSEARVKIDALDASDDVRRAVMVRLNRLERASRTDLSIASRQLEAFHATLDAGQIPLYD